MRICFSEYVKYSLEFSFFLLILAIISILFVPANKTRFINQLALFFTGFLFLISVAMIYYFKPSYFYYQYIFDLFCSKTLFFNLDFSFGLDGIALLFLFLTNLLSFLCVIFIFNISFLNKKTLILNLLFVQLCLFFIFSSLNLFVFYIFFEFLLVPMYFIIGFWGSRSRKIRASYLLLYYTIASSILLLVAIFHIYVKIGTFSMEVLRFFSFDYDEIWLWFAFFLSFAAKAPLFPFHIWLPEAHVEAPTIGSVILAGILLKLGVFGFIRYNLCLFPNASMYFVPMIYLICILGILYASLNAIRQTDLKRIIAYSSVAHMNLVVMGIFCLDIIGINGAIIQSLSHGFVSGALFFCIGILYERYHSRLLIYYSGLVHFMPLFSFMFLFFTMANIALPGTSSFVGEFLLLLAIFSKSSVAGFFAALGVILSSIYAIWLFNRIIFGNIKNVTLLQFTDLNKSEFFILVFLVVFVLLIGIVPSYFLEFLTPSILKIISRNYDFDLI